MIERKDLPNLLRDETGRLGLPRTERLMREAADQIEALEAALKEADYVAEKLAASRRSHGYVIASVASMDGHLEGYLKYRALTDAGRAALEQGDRP